MDHKAKVAALGCITCLIAGRGFSPAQLHHPYGRKGKNNDVVLPLCFNCHQSGRNDADFVSRHPWKRAWQVRYGTEAELLEKLNTLLKEKEA